MVIGIWDDGDIEFRSFDIKNGQAGAVEADGAFFYDEVAEFFWEFEGIFPAAVEVAAFDTDGSGIDVSLDDVSVEAAVHDEASFEVDEVSGLPVAEIGLFKCLFDRGNAVEVILYFFDGEASAVMGYALVNGQLLGDGGFYPECFVGALGLDGVYFSERFDDSGKHRLQFRKIWVSISIFRNLSYLCSPKN